MAAALPLPPLDEVFSFVKEYYKILNESPEEAHTKYAETSKLLWPGSESFVTTLSSIKHKILSSEYKNCRAVVRHPFVPASHLGGVFVAVRGQYVDKDSVVSATFFQTFLLCVKQQKDTKKGALYIVNDFLQVLDNTKKAVAAPAAAASNTNPAAEAFVREYYKTLNNSRERAHKMYAETSTLRWPDSDGVARPVTTPSSRNEKIMFSDYNGCSAEVVTLVVPASHPEAAFVAVRGRFLDNTGVLRAHFFQNFILSTKDKLILNDNLQVVVDAPKSVQPRPVAPKKTTVAPPPPPRPEAAFREVFLVNLPEQLSQNRVTEVLKKFGAVKRNSVKMGTRDNRDGSYTFFALVEFQSPESARLAVEARVVFFGGKKATVEYKKAGGVSVPLEKEVSQPKSPRVNMYVPGRGVFVACLPHDATKNMVATVLRRFGPVRRQNDAVQLRTRENGNGSYTTNAIVEFESPESARLAVEAGVVKFGDKKATVEYKKPSKMPRPDF